MALNRIDYPSNLTDQSDFSAHGELIESRYLDQTAAPLQVRDGVIPQGVVLQIGGVLYRSDSDTSISGTASDYVRVTPDGATASADYVADLTGVAWNAQYNGYYDSQSPARLYLFNEKLAHLNGDVETIRTRYVEVDSVGDAGVPRDFTAGRRVNYGEAVNYHSAEEANDGMRHRSAGDHVFYAGGFNERGRIKSNGDYVADRDIVAGRHVNVDGVIRKGNNNPNLIGGGRASGFYTGSARDETNLPVGSIVAAFTQESNAANRNELKTVRLSSSSEVYTIDGSGPILSGNWRSRGISGGATGIAYYLFQRVS